MSRDERIVDYLEEHSIRIMFSLDIKSRTDMINNESLFKKYKKEMKRVLNKQGVSKKSKVSKEVRKILEGRNLHSINWAIQELNYGEGDF